MPRLVGSVASATMLTVLGYAMVLTLQLSYARLLGVTAATDALAAALVWVNSAAWLIGTVFISVMVPLYARHLHDPVRARALLRAASSIAAALGIGLAVATGVFAEDVGRILLPGARPETHTQVVGLLQLTAPMILLLIAVAILTTLANARECYRLVAGVTILQPLVVIAAILTFVPTVELAAAGFTIGTGIQVVVLLAGTRAWVADALPIPGIASLRPVIARALPIGAAFLFIYVAVIAARSIASLGPPGDVTVLDYANRLVGAAEQAALAGIMAIALTAWSLDAASDQDLRLPITGTFRVAMGVFASAAMVGILLTPEIVSLLFEGGQFGTHEVGALAGFLRWMLPGVAAHALLMLGIRVLLARDANSAVVLTGLTHLLVFVTVGGLAPRIMGLDGLALAYSLSWFAACLVCLGMIRSRLGFKLGLRTEISRVAFAAIGAFAIAALVLSIIPPSNLARLVVGFIVFATIFFALGRWRLVGFVSAIEKYIRARSGGIA